jgi:hypothetical protein
MPVDATIGYPRNVEQSAPGEGASAQAARAAAVRAKDEADRAGAAGAEAGAAAGLEAVQPVLEETQGLASAVAASVANAAPSYTTWAALNATTPANLSIAVLINNDRAHARGQYRRISGVWTWESDTLPGVDARVAGISDRTANRRTYDGLTEGSGAIEGIIPHRVGKLDGDATKAPILEGTDPATGIRHIFQPTKLHQQVDAPAGNTPDLIPEIDGGWKILRATKNGVPLTGLSARDGATYLQRGYGPRTGMARVAYRDPFEGYTFGAGNTGTTASNNNSGLGRFAAFDDGVFDLYLYAGQSLALGMQNYTLGDDNPADFFLPLSTAVEHAGYAYMPQVSAGNGLRPKGRAITGLDALKSVPYDNEGGSPTYEHPGVRSLNTILSLQQAYFGRRQRSIMLAAGEGGRTLAALGPGSTPYAEMVRCLQEMVRIAREQYGMGVRLRGIFWVQGENESSQQFGPGSTVTGVSQSTHEAELDWLHRQIDQDAFAVLDHQRDVPMMFVGQHSFGFNASTVGFTPKIKLAQLGVQRRNPFIRTSVPRYSLVPSRGQDRIHTDPWGYSNLGDQEGAFAFHNLFGYGMRCPQIEEAWQTDDTHVVIRWNEAMVADATGDYVRVDTLGAGLGIDPVDGTASPPTVTLVEAVAGAEDQFRLTLSAPFVGYRRRLYVGCRRNQNNAGNQDSGRTGWRAVDPLMNATHVSPGVPAFSGTVAKTYPTPYRLYRWASNQIVALS